MLMIPKTVSTPIRSSSFSRSSATVIFWVIPTNSSAPTGWVSCHYLNHGLAPVATLFHRSAAAYLAAERRKSVAQGVSPGFAVTNEFSPVGAKENQYDLVKPLRGCVPSRGAAKEGSPGRQPWVYRH